MHLRNLLIQMYFDKKENGVNIKTTHNTEYSVNHLLPGLNDVNSGLCLRDYCVKHYLERTAVCPLNGARGM